MDLFVTPYRICTSIFIKVYCAQRLSLAPKENGKICMFILDIIRQNEYSFKHFTSLISSNCDSTVIIGQFRRVIDETIVDINNLFELVKQMRECPHIENNSVSGLYLRKVAIYFDRLTHQACSMLYDDLIAYVANPNTSLRRRGPSVAWQTPRTTRSSKLFLDFNETAEPIYQLNHEISRLQANEQCALNPKDLYESLRRPNNSAKSDACFLRYLNLLRVNESVGSKHLLMAYFDMVSDTVSRSYSALNYAIWYLHHGEYKRAIECLQECYCCAQAADDDKCLLIALMWLARIIIQAKQKNSSKYNVTMLLELVRKRSHKANMPYVEAMSSMTLEQLIGPVDDSEALKKSSATLKQVALNSKQQNQLLAATNQPNPLDKDDFLPSAEILAVRNSMNDVLAMYYALLSAHMSLTDASQSSALASQTLLHFDLIEKCGNEDVFMVNENIFIAIRNLAYHAWNSTRNIMLVREMLVDMCSTKIPIHRTDHHSIWRQAFSEISFEYYVEKKNWSDATKMISIIRETDPDGAQLCQAELLKLMGIYDEALYHVDDLIKRIEFEESNMIDPAELDGEATPYSVSNNNLEEENEYTHGQRNNILSAHPSLSIEHKAYIKAKALLLRAVLINDETKILESLNYATKNRFLHVRTACLLQLARLWVDKPDKIMESIVIEVFANGTRTEKRELRQMLKDSSTETDDNIKTRSKGTSIYFQP